MIKMEWSLNPCFNGRYSQSFDKAAIARFGIVLILVLMEDTLRVGQDDGTFVEGEVLILVLMEDTLREQNLRVLEFRGFDNSKTYKIGFY